MVTYEPELILDVCRQSSEGPAADNEKEKQDKNKQEREQEQETKFQDFMNKLSQGMKSFSSSVV